MNLAGVFAPLPTPFDEHDRLDTRRLRDALPHWIASPLTGFVLLGTTGELGLLDDDECDRVIATAREFIPAGRPLIVGAGRESTAATVRAARRAADGGADAVLVRTPSYFKSQMTPDRLADYYRGVADASPIPLLLYNFTAATGVKLSPSTVCDLARHTNVVGIKESGSDITQIADLVTLTEKPFAVLSGSASTFYSALTVGVAGGILALAALLPDACVRLFHLVRECRYEDARALQRELLPLARSIATYGVPGVKAALKLQGCDVGWPRLPLAPASPEAMAALERALMKIGEAAA